MVAAPPVSGSKAQIVALEYSLSFSTIRVETARPEDWIALWAVKGLDGGVPFDAKITRCDKS
jgi:hypothetical protein